MNRTLAQERAKYAYDRVIEFKSDPNSKEYKSLVKGFPSMIVNNGLGQALAFLKAKKKGHHNRLYEDVNEWFKKDHSPVQIQNGILETIMDGSSASYRYLTEESLLLINWFKKFVDAEIKSD